MYVYHAYPSDLRLMLTLIPYSINLCDCHHRSNKLRHLAQTSVSHIKLLESGMHVITLTKGKELGVDGVVPSKLTGK